MRYASRSCAVLAGLLLLGGCFSARGADRGARFADHAVLTDTQIAAAGVQTAWEALRLVNGLRLVENVEGQPVGLYQRGLRSLGGSNTPLIVVDGTIHRDFRQLDRMPAHDLASIRIRSPSAASAEFGSLAQNGVVELTTHRP